jgi:GTP-binding protein LepA
MSIPQERIRNFCIIAHIDHGKSTLADRLLQFTNTGEARKMREQTLDTMDIERERGITIKSVAVRMDYRAKDGLDYRLHLIDTPGHVDFAYEVSRSMASCEGSLLLVDAAQGVEAQTLANAYKAVEQNLEIIPVINKVDLPSADIESARRQIDDVIGLDSDGAVLASGKTGLGTVDVLEAVVTRMPPPKGDPNAPLRALIFDASYDTYRGVIVYICVKDGRIQKGQRIQLMSNGIKYMWTRWARSTPRWYPLPALQTGDVGYMVCSIKSLQDTRIGDTVTDANSPAPQPLPGYKEVKPVVFCGPLPRGHHRLRRTPRRPGKAPAERLFLRVRGRQLRRAGPGLPPGLPGPAPHGNHPGAPGARVRPDPRDHHAQRGVPDHQDQRRSLHD